MQAGVKERYDTFIANMIINGMNGSLAVRETPGYSNNNTRQRAKQLLTVSYIKQGLAKKQAKLVLKQDITAEYVVGSFKDIADANKTKKPFVAVRALEQLGKHLGIYEKDNEQKAINITDILAIVGIRNG